MFPSPLRLPPSHSSARSILCPHLGEPPAIVPPPPPVHDPPRPLCLQSVTSSLRWMYSSTRGIVSKHRRSLLGQAWVYLVSILCRPRPVCTLLWNEHIQESLRTQMGTEIVSKLSVRNRSGAGRLSVARVSHHRFLVCSLGTDIALSHYPIVIPFLFLSTLESAHPLHAMHHVAQQNASDIKLSATGKELVTVIPVSAKPMAWDSPGHIPAHPASVAAIKTNASSMLSSQCMCGFLSHLKKTDEPKHPRSDKYVSRSEFDKLKICVDHLEALLLCAQPLAAAASCPESSPHQSQQHPSTRPHAAVPSGSTHHAPQGLAPVPYPLLLPPDPMIPGQTPVGLVVPSSHGVGPGSLAQDHYLSGKHS